MALFTPDIDNLRELYTSMMRHQLSAEKQLVDDGLPAMIKNATAPELQNAFRTHLEETRQHVSRLERVLQENGVGTDDSKCKIMAALISGGSSVAKETTDSALRDVSLIAAGNQVEHHEIAVYGTLRNFAIILNESQHAELFEKTLAEEKNADKVLTTLSDQINVEAPVGAGK